jgi:hypothetical protein
MSVFLKYIKGNNKELYVTFNYTDARVEAVRAIQGRKWDPGKKRWIIPFTEEAVRSLYEKLPEDKIIPDSLLVSWVRSIIQKQHLQTFLKSAEEALEEYMQMEQEQIDEIIKAMSLAGLEKQLYLAQRNRNGYCGR